MKRWKGSTNWALVWGFFILVGGMILYTGYLSALYYTSQESTPMMTNEADQAVSENTAQVPKPEPEPKVGSGSKASKVQNWTKKMTADDQESVSINSNLDQEIPSEKNLKNFPYPVPGSPLRSVGNYYSEAFNNYLFHAGTDFAELEGTMIRATHGGKVIFAGADPILGQKVILDCGDGWLVTYGGLDNLRVEVGKTIEAQDALGQIGFFTAAESESGQPQLHYEVWHGDVVQNPL